jgi:peptidyl-prolyl cis-trans isomerase B (cyclophilin B)
MVSFNQFYYSFSPTIADYERENPIFKEVVKLTLTPLLISLTSLQYADIDSEFEMLVYGIGIIILNVIMYFIVPTILIMKIRKRVNMEKLH